MRTFIRIARFATIATLAGTCFGVGSCSDVAGFISNINPCGTILNCDPIEYQFISSGYEGPGADPDIDPTCTYPPYCNYQVDPNPDPFAPDPG